ncbi:hypothetical protein D1AOALGA4SA_4168 [Olavius algarvensis Delta 1 endosymbiont]|nr:hypothetical protein D1AOALGA4SA_4168 [Olavius algarvensis Delta 1 endosymbiont]
MNSEVGMRNAEKKKVGRWDEFGLRQAQTGKVGMRNAEKKKVGIWEGGLRRAQAGQSGTRRRPVMRDFAAAKDAEGGKKEGEG